MEVVNLARAMTSDILTVSTESIRPGRPTVPTMRSAIPDNLKSRVGRQRRGPSGTA